MIEPEKLLKEELNHILNPKGHDVRAKIIIAAICFSMESAKDFIEDLNGPDGEYYRVLKGIFDDLAIDWSYEDGGYVLTYKKELNPNINYEN